MTYQLSIHKANRKTDLRERFEEISGRMKTGEYPLGPKVPEISCIVEIIMSKSHEREYFLFTKVHSILKI